VEQTCGERPPQRVQLLPFSKLLESSPSMVDEVLLKQVMSSTLKVEPSAITPASTSETLENWDSLKHLNLILALEEAFDVSIPDEEAANITSYALIKSVLEDLLKGR
jgi:acyl carrier protein